MKKLFFMLLRAFVFSALVTQLAAIAFYKLPLGLHYRKAYLPIIYAAAMTLALLFENLRKKEPRIPVRRLKRILRTDGYSYEFYAIMKRWCEKCEKKGCKTSAVLTFSELLIEGGRCKEALDLLAALETKEMSAKQRCIYFNAYLYGAVLCGDREAADEIYRCARLDFAAACTWPVACSVKHTLACYEYMRGNLKRAEELFMQSIAGCRTFDSMCENYLGLSACYLDTDRPLQAKAAVERASKYAVNPPMKKRLERAKLLVERAYGL